MKKYFAAFSLVALLMAAPAWAQDLSMGAQAESAEDQKTNTDGRFEKNRRGGVFYLMLGNNSFDLNDLNSRLSSNGYSTLDKNFVIFGIGGHAVMDDWIAGGEIHWMNQQKTSNGTYDLYVTGGYFMVNAGYVVRRADSYMIYPMAGIGIGTLSINEQSTAAQTFDQALTAPKGGTLTHTSAVFNIAIAADGLAPFTKTENNVNMPFAFGFRAGYLFSTPIGGWQNMNGEAGGGPSFSFTGPYLQVIIGLGFMVG